MKRFFFLASAFVLPIVFIGIVPWQKPWQLLLLSGVYLTLLTLITLWLALRRKTPCLPDDYYPGVRAKKPPIGPFVLRGMLLGASTVVGGGFLIYNAPSWQWFSGICDVQRESETARLASHEAAGEFDEAITRIEELLADDISNDWKAELRRERLRLLEAWSQVSPCPQDEELLNRAIACANNDGLDATTVKLRLDLLRMRRAEDNWTRRAEEQMRNLAVSEQEAKELRDRLKTSEAESAINQQHLTQYKADATSAYAVRIRDTLIRWGDASHDDPEAQLPIFEEASAIETRYRITALPNLAAKIALVRQRITAATPRDLPNDLKLAVLGIHLDRQPFVEVDLKIESSAGQHVSGITANDIRVSSGERHIRPLAIAEQLGQAERQYVLILIDVSSSMQGKPIEAVKQGLRQLIEKLPASTQIRLVSFATTVTVVCDWTTDRKSLTTGIMGLKSDGTTMLNRAISEELPKVSKIDGHMSIMLFTDGRDSGGGRDSAAVLRAASQARVPINTVAYTQGDVDRAFLTQLATASGGTFSETTQVERLSESLVASAERLTAQFYRLVFVADSSTPIKIELGKARMPSLNLNLHPTSHTAARN